MAAPPISIRCECGEAHSLAYGEEWTCERCGRHWNTRQIPAQEYFGRLRRMRLFRLELLGLVALGIGVFFPLIIFVNPTLIVPAGIASVMFIVLYMPYWRRRVQRAAADAPRWELHPE